MAVLKLNNVPVLTESGGVAQMANTLKFPAGHVLQVKTGGYGTQTTIGTSQVYVIDLEFATIGTNSLFVATAHFSVGNYSDVHGFQGGVTLNSGSTPTTSGNAMIQGSPSACDSGAFMYDDIGNSRLNGYAFTSHTWQLYKSSNFAAGITVSCGLWFKGINTMYINRCANRGSHEGSYTTLVIYEVAA